MAYTDSKRRACKKYMESHKDILRERRKQWELKNPEKAKAAWKRNYEKYKAHHQARKRKYREQRNAHVNAVFSSWKKKNEQHCVQWRKQWRTKNKEILSVKKKQWLDAHPGYASAYDGMRRDKKLKCSKIEITVIKKWMREVRSKRFARCYWCGTKVEGKKIEFDHIIPLAKQGTHSIGNLCASCFECNHRKHAKTLTNWIVNGQMFLL